MEKLSDNKLNSILDNVSDKIPTTKVCSKCGIEKSLNSDNFCKNKANKHGFSS